MKTLFNWIQSSGATPFPVKLPGWVQALLGSAGGWGLFVVAFVDSSFGSFPVINDLLVVWLTIANPGHMVFYATMATLGSVLGCLVVFSLAHKGGEIVLHKRASPEQIERIRRWYERNEFLTVAVPAVLPPPTPFKLFVLAAGAFQVRWQYFVAALLLGRGVRYFLWGLLTIRYGERTIVFLRSNYLQVSGGIIALMLFVFLLFRLAERYRDRRSVASGA